MQIRSKTTARISICTLNPLKSPSNQVHIWRQFPVVARQLFLITDTFPYVNLTKKMTNLLIVWKITEKDCNDLYFHSCTFNMSYKSFSFLMTLSPRGHVNSSTTTFGNINLTETGIDLIIDSNFNKNGCKNLYLYPKSSKITFKPNSYMMSICWRGQVDPSTYTFCSIDMIRTMAYWCSQKVVAYYENIIKNLERVFKLFWNTIWSLCEWFICFLSSYS